MATIDEDLYKRQYRRYSAMLVKHPVLQSTQDFYSKFADVLKTRGRRILPASTKSDFREFQYLRKSSLYPNAIANGPSANGLFPHYISVSAIAGASVKSDQHWLLVSAPYVRILREIDKQLRLRAKESTMVYLVPRIDRVFEFMSRYRPSLKATRITVQISGDVGVEQVTLTGRNPLRSDLVQALNSVAEPYSIRIDVTEPDEKVGVYLDRHGNFWWYLRSPKQLANVTRLVRELLDQKLTQIGVSVPLSREDEV